MPVDGAGSTRDEHRQPGQQRDRDPGPRPADQLAQLNARASAAPPRSDAGRRWRRSKTSSRVRRSTDELPRPRTPARRPGRSFERRRAAVPSSVDRRSAVVAGARTSRHRRAAAAQLAAARRRGCVTSDPPGRRQAARSSGSWSHEAARGRLIAGPGADQLHLGQQVARQEHRGPARDQLDGAASRISWMPCGSSPLVGSSRTSSRGPRSSAAARPSRWRMPSE